MGSGAKDAELCARLLGDLGDCAVTGRRVRGGSTQR